MKLDIERVVSTLCEVAPPPAPLHEPRFGNAEAEMVVNCLEDGWVSYYGAYVNRFEEELAAFCGVNHAVATVSGTSALHAIIHMMGIGHGDEVLAPALTFVASINAIAYTGAVAHFVDAEDTTFGIDAGKVAEHLHRVSERRDGTLYNKETGRRIAALMCMHVFGHPSDLDALTGVCEEFGIPLIEDAAEALGSFYKGAHVGNRGYLSALSFNGNKVITTGGGGAILCNDDALAERARRITTTARVPHPYEFSFDEVAFNYRMPNINAAVGCGQMLLLPGYLEKKRRLAVRYAEAFSEVEGIRHVSEPADCVSNYWINVLLLDPGYEDNRVPVLEAAHAVGLGARAAWIPVSQLKMYADCPRMDLSVTENLYDRIINVPSSPHLADGE
ncbi:MAG: LegC family aminotransferase [Rhodospirillales bacterium]|jgi:perosamine synthetase|nr:LegC family aminotransferase [Rhodospirillales bacterium]